MRRTVSFRWLLEGSPAENVSPQFFALSIPWIVIKLEHYSNLTYRVGSLPGKLANLEFRDFSFQAKYVEFFFI